jgi:hypothetical protein
MFDQLNLDDLRAQATKLGKDGLYFAIGLGVVTFQKIQEQFTDLREQLDTQVASGRDQLSTLTSTIEPQIKALDGRIDSLETRVRELIAQYGDQLPEPAEKAIDRAFDTAKSARTQVRDFWLGETKADTKVA